MTGVCIRSKSYCIECDKNKDGWYSWVDKSVDEIYKQWEKNRNRRKKVKE